jgi:ATP-dependent Clp protease adaptor protein ClpS
LYIICLIDIITKKVYVLHEIREDTKVSIEKPKMYKVYLLNDDYTTMNFVIDVLEEIFLKSRESAVLIMYKIHNEGKGLCGLYPYEIASTKMEQVKFLASNNSFPLKAKIEQE